MGGPPKGNKKQKPPKPKTVKKKSLAVIVAATQERPYETLLREAKSAIKGDAKTLETVKTVRKTKEGNLLIEVTGRDPEATRQVKDLLTSKMANTRMRTATGETRIVKIIGLDNLTTEEKVKEAVAEAVKEEGHQSREETLELVAVRKERGRRVAALQMGRTEAKKVTERG